MDLFEALLGPVNPLPVGIADNGEPAVESNRRMVSLSYPWLQSAPTYQDTWAPGVAAYQWRELSFSPVEFVQGNFQPGRVTKSNDLPVYPQPSEVQAQMEQELLNIQDLLPGAP